VHGLLDLEIPTRFITGNCERVVLAALAGGDISEVPVAYQDQVRRAAAQLDERCLDAIRSWPKTCALTVDGIGDVFFCHATARNDREMFTADTPDPEVAAMFDTVKAPLVICGHTHIQFDRRVGSRRIVNAGSVGMPFAPPPGGEYLLIGPNIDLSADWCTLKSPHAKTSVTVTLAVATGPACQAQLPSMKVDLDAVTG
jgi:diadenosine tetraphosphatase ApaH/serine/threonine PP2A family protein phosphatase